MIVFFYTLTCFQLTKTGIPFFNKYGLVDPTIDQGLVLLMKLNDEMLK